MGKLVVNFAPADDGHPRQPLTGTSLGGLAAANVLASTFGQCSCGQTNLGIRYEANRDGEVISNVPCGHRRPSAPFRT
ncbi:hypothetical protein [Streptomyces sp. NPDC046685]|uniref:hypothetical protein n=1 Tax=Streptomyces sp. NPDC046685 TaxID=3157202 RepID=UPI0033CC1847